MRNITIMSRQSVKNLLPMLDHDVAVISISSVSGIPLTAAVIPEGVTEIGGEKYPGRGIYRVKG